MLGWWWHPCWLTCVGAASHLPLSLAEGVVLGMGPRVVSVTPTEAELPRGQAAALGPAQLGLSAPHPAPLRGAAPQLPSIPFQPQERCPLPTLSHCLGISPETLHFAVLICTSLGSFISLHLLFLLVHALPCASCAQGTSCTSFGGPGATVQHG